MLILQEWGFKVNPYEWCVTKKSFDSKQMTVIWHVDELKIYHINRDRADALISHISK